MLFRVIKNIKKALAQNEINRMSVIVYLDFVRWDSREYAFKN